MKYSLVNKITERKLKIADIQKIIEQINKNNSSDKYNKYNVYIDFGGSDGMLYLNNTTDNKSIFINICKSYVNKQEYKYLFITLNSFNPNLSEVPIYKNNEFKNLLNFFKVSKEYKINLNGYIYIFLNNSCGFFKDNFISNINIFILNLIDKIRKFSNRKILLRFHPKDIIKDISVKTYDYISKNYKLKYNDNNLEYSDEDIFKVKKNIYCGFIQNSKLLFEFIFDGIPLFNLNLIKFNYFDIFVKDISNIEKLNKINLPNRINFLKKYIRFIFLNDENLIKKLEEKYKI